MKKDKNPMILVEKMIDGKIIREEKKNFVDDLTFNTNDEPLIKTDQAVLNAIIKKPYPESEWLIISASKEIDKSKSSLNKEDLLRQAAINEEQFRKMIKRVADSNYSLCPIFGAFIEEKDGEDKSFYFEKSLIVFPTYGSGEERDFERMKIRLKHFAVRFQQKTIFIKDGHKSPYFFNLQTMEKEEAVNKQLFEGVGESGMEQILTNYFTQFNNSLNPASRLTFFGSYINPEPLTYTEQVKRNLLGERHLKY